jgi:hypothetical protein
MGSLWSSPATPKVYNLSSITTEHPQFEQNIKAFCQVLADDGFVVIGLEVIRFWYYSSFLKGKYSAEIDKLYKVGLDFVKQDHSVKALNEDPKREGLGYVGSPNAKKEYLKVPFSSCC